MKQWDMIMRQWDMIIWQWVMIMRQWDMIIRQWEMIIEQWFLIIEQWGMIMKQRGMINDQRVIIIEQWDKIMKRETWSMIISREIQYDYKLAFPHGDKLIVRYDLQRTERPDDDQILDCQWSWEDGENWSSKEEQLASTGSEWWSEEQLAEREDHQLAVSDDQKISWQRGRIINWQWVMIRRTAGREGGSSTGSEWWSEDQLAEREDH